MNHQDSVSQADERAFTLYPTRPRVLLIFIGSLALVAASIYMILNSSDPWRASLGIFVTVVCALGALLFLLMLVKPVPLLQVSDEGFRQWSFWGKIYLVSWEEIAFIFLSTARLSSSLNVYLSEAGLKTFSARYPWRGRLCRLTGNLVVTVSFLMSPIPVQEILDTIQERYQQQIEQYHIYVR